MSGIGSKRRTAWKRVNVLQRRMKQISDERDMLRGEVDALQALVADLDLEVLALHKRAAAAEQEADLLIEGSVAKIRDLVAVLEYGSQYAKQIALSQARDWLAQFEWDGEA